MIGKIKNWWGASTLDRDEYEKAMSKVRAEDARRQMDAARQMQNSITSTYPYLAQNNAAQMTAQQQERYAQGWNDPRGLMQGSALQGAVPMNNEKLLIDSLADTNRAMSRLAERMDTQERRVQMLTGFYTWVTEVHPEIAAQHKAMRDLYEAANAPQQEQGEQDA